MRVVILISLALAASCNWGTRPTDFPPALGPNGAHVALRVLGEPDDRLAELIAVDSVGISIRGDGDRRIVRVPWSQVGALAVANASDDYEVHPGETVTPEKRARIALLSRFPQGLRHLPITIDSLVPRARSSTTRFTDRRVAVAEGYRRVGADFPGMGEHWINPDMLFAGRIDPARPALLTYATIAGTPTLLGVGFMMITRGDSVPRDMPGWPSGWHEHSGLLADESGGRGTGTASDTHVWVMHVWTVLENPDGVLAADNWALPYVRAGRPVSRHADADAARALSLTVDGDAFLRGALTDAGLRTERNALAVDSALDAARGRALATRRDGMAADSELHETWSALASDLERLVGPGVHAVLMPSHAGAHR